jgi:hypothetical protein
MARPIIRTPRGTIVVNQYGKAELKFNANFRPKFQKQFSEAQEWVDNEVLRVCDPFVPFRTGMLRSSGILGTKIGSGQVSYIAPYARAQYYSPRTPGSSTGPQRGPFWFHRAMELHKPQIIAGARKLAGTGKK